MRDHFLIPIHIQFNLAYSQTFTKFDYARFGQQITGRRTTQKIGVQIGCDCLFDATNPAQDCCIQGIISQAHYHGTRNGTPGSKKRLRIRRPDRRFTLSEMFHFEAIITRKRKHFPGQRLQFLDRNHA